MLQKMIEWVFQNKLITFLGLLSFCLLISVIALSSQKNSREDELNQCRTELDALKHASTTTPAPPTNATAASTVPETSTNSSTIAPQKNTTKVSKLFRLTREVIPLNYDILLDMHVDLETTKFGGKLAIEVAIKQPTDNIILNQHWLNLTKVEFKDDDHRNIPVLTWKADDSKEIVTITAVRTLTPGNYSMIIEYEGYMAKNIVGLYSTLTNNNGCKLLSIFKLRKLNMLGYRLSKHIIPSNYDLTLHPDLISGKFNGIVNISVKVKKVMNRIYFHANNLNLCNVKVLNADKNEVKVENCYSTKDNELAVLDLSEEIEPGQYNIQIDFDGDLTNKIVGFYSSRFRDNTKIASSKFEPTYARQAFPCFDEPGFKATFDVKLVKPTHYIALSNMNQVEIEKMDSDTDVVTFAKSVPMSTYLICFVVCNFKYIEDEVDTNSIGEPFTLRSFAREDQLNKICFAQNVGKKAVEFYIQYYQVPFPLPKLDMIAIPDYVSGATEHWGLITFRETSFLADMETSSSQNLLRVATVVCHELAHMWFGNLGKGSNTCWSSAGKTSHKARIGKPNPRVFNER